MILFRDIIRYIPTEERIYITNQANLFARKPNKTNSLLIFLDEIGYSDCSYSEIMESFEMNLTASNKLGIENVNRQKAMEQGSLDYTDQRFYLKFIRNGIPILKQRNVGIFEDTIIDFYNSISYKKDLESDIFYLFKKMLLDSRELEPISQFDIYKSDKPLFVPIHILDHAVGVILYKDYLIIGDRRDGEYISGEGLVGTVVYKLKSRGIISKEIMKQLNSILNRAEFDALIASLTESKPLMRVTGEYQKRGTCTYTSFKAALKGFCALECQLREKEYSDIPIKKISLDAFNLSNEMYKNYANHYRDVEINKNV